MTQIAEGIRALDARGIHFVLCRDDKRPIQTAWQKVKPDAETVAAYLADGGIVGYMPASLGLGIVDVDEGDPNIVKAKIGIQEVFDTGTPSGGRHIAYRITPDAKLNNGKFKLPGCAGDLRIGNGYVCCYDWSVVIAAFENEVSGQAVCLHSVLKSKRVNKAARIPKAVDPPSNPKPIAGALSTHNEFLALTMRAQRCGDPEAARENLRAEWISRKVSTTGRCLTDAAGLAEFDRMWDSAVEKAKESRAVLGSDGTSLICYPKTGPDEIADALGKLGYRIRYNLRWDCLEYRLGEVEIEGVADHLLWDRMTDKVRADIRMGLLKHFCVMRSTGPAPFRVTHTDLTDALLHLAVDSDPFRDDYLLKLKPWDGDPVMIGDYPNYDLELFSWPTRFFGAEKSVLTAWAGALPYITGVARTLKPGAVAPECTVLLGAQDIGKSSWLQFSVPQWIEGLFTDHLDLSASTKEMSEAVKGRLLVEIGEMLGATGRRASRPRLKTFLTRLDDGGVRHAYRRDPAPQPRRAAFAGSSDRDECLPNDPAGNRRFIVLRLESECRDIPKIMDDGLRDLLWRQALAWVRAGGASRLPRAFKSAQKTANADHRRADVFLEEAVLKINWIEVDPNTGASLLDIARKINEVSDVDVIKATDGYAGQLLAEALVHAGAESRRVWVGGRRVRRWFPPESDEPIV